jgi:Fic family protein
MVAATTALDTMIRDVQRDGRVELAAITAAHEALMRGDPLDAGYAGRLRDMQNWIGGSDYSPRGALYVPPPPDTVESFLDDLISFANRDDLPARWSRRP